MLAGLEFGETEAETPAEDTPETPADEVTPEETPETPEETPADEPEAAAPEEPEADPEEPEAAAPTKPTPPAKDAAPDARATRDARLAEIKKELATLKAVPKDDFDPFDHGKRIVDLLAEKDELQEGKLAEMEEAAAEETFWQKWKREHPVVGDKGRSIWDEEIKAAKKKYSNPAAVSAVANEGWERRVKLIEAQKRAADERNKPNTPAAGKGKVPVKAGGKPVPPVTQGGARAVPAGAVGRPAPKPRTPEEAFVSAAQGSMKGFLR
jgi:hypothetical protein